jgi:hypothetical protein
MFDDLIFIDGIVWFDDGIDLVPLCDWSDFLTMFGTVQREI